MRIIAAAKMRFFRVVMLLLMCVAAARGQEIVRQTIPGKWLEPVLPEDAADLHYPQWAGELDKAKLEQFSGYYKKSLMTLMNLQGGDPIQIALIKGKSLDALGRKDE